MRNILITILMLFIFTNCRLDNKKSKAITNIEYNPKGQLEIGTLDSLEYRNNYFGFTFNCPFDKWIILNKKQYLQRLTEKQEELNVSDKTWNKTTYNLHNLITIDKIPIDTTMTCTQSISFTAECLDSIPNVNSSLEYLKYTDYYCNKHLSINYPKYKVTGLDTAFVGKRIFLVQSIQIEDELNKFRYQKTYSAQFGRFLLNILVNYYTEDEQNENERILSNVKWDK